MNSKSLKCQFVAAGAMLLVSAIALTSATYAWYVANNTVQATTTTISATTNGFILQIATADEGPQHGGEQTSLAASTEGGRITPSSTNDLKTWYVNQGINGEGKVTSYTQPKFVAGENSKPGEYIAGGETHYAYIKSEYILYTITETGLADVYLDSSEGSPVTITANGTPTTDTIPKSLRVGITIQNIKKNADGTYSDDGTEELKVVYAPYAETGKGNDDEAIDGWSYIGADTDGKLKPLAVTYPYIYGTTYTDQNYNNWAATKVGENYEVTSDTQKIASSVGYDGVKMRVYIWMEGTDADCINNEAAEDTATYNVNVKLAGISAE